MTGADIPKNQIPDECLVAGARLTRADLIRRWRHGSDSLFWRAEADGLLVPVRHGRSVYYTWPAVFEFEGGQPPDGLDAEYRADLMTPEQVGTLASRSRGWVLAAARGGDLPSRSVGLQRRFVPAEVRRWIEGWA